MKNKIILKVIIAGLLAFLVLNIFAYFYYNVPTRKDDISGSTDYKWPSNVYHTTNVEGFGSGHVNNDGYNNLLDYEEGEDIDILLMGSSHAEGFNIAEDENIAAVLNGITDDYTYNIGISEHTLLNCISNLEDALNKYQPKKYVVIEMMTVSFYDDEIKKALNNENELPTYSNGVLDFLQNFKYLKLAYYQYNNLNKSTSSKGSESITSESLLDNVLSYAENLCEKNNIKLILVFHPTISVENDGRINAVYNREDEETFENVCEENNIAFINMEEDFIENYKDSQELPHGFNNTVPGSGHLNKTGHRLIAEKLKEVMEGSES